MVILLSSIKVKAKTFFKSQGPLESTWIMPVAYLVIRILSSVGLHLSFRFCFAQEFLSLLFFLFLVGSKFTLQVNNSGEQTAPL